MTLNQGLPNLPRRRGSQLAPGFRYQSNSSEEDLAILLSAEKWDFSDGEKVVDVPCKSQFVDDEDPEFVDDEDPEMERNTGIRGSIRLKNTIDFLKKEVQTKKNEISEALAERENLTNQLRMTSRRISVLMDNRRKKAEARDSIRINGISKRGSYTDMMKNLSTSPSSPQLNLGGLVKTNRSTGNFAQQPDDLSRSVRIDGISGRAGSYNMLMKKLSESQTFSTDQKNATWDV